MKTKKKKKTEDPPAATPDLTTTAAAVVDPSSIRNWSNFSEDLLLQIFSRLSFSAPGRLIFSGVCQSWRSLAAASAPFSGPPLLLNPTLTRPRSGPRRWARPARCRLQTLTDGNRSYGCPVSARTLRRSCVGSSFGQLIFVGGKKAIISDVFTGEEGSDVWSELKVGALIGGKIVSLAVAKGKTFVLVSTPNPFPTLIFVRKFHPYVAWRRVGLPTPNRTFALCAKCDPYLVERGGELLLVVFGATGHNRVYRLDPLSFLWEKIESLGNWCLFVHRKQAMACPDPTRWGGQNNCVYFIRPGCILGSWSVVPFDGEVVDTKGDFPFSDDTLALKLFPWPSPIWVYPSMLLESHNDQT